MLDQHLRILVFLIFTTNGSEGMASGANHAEVCMFTPSRCVVLLLETHQKQLKKLTEQYFNNLDNNQILTFIGWNGIHSLRGQYSPNPTGFISTTDKHEETTLTCDFLSYKENGEQWTTSITYPNQLGSKHQV